MSWTIFYTTEHQEATILGCFGSEPSLSLPDEIDGFPVVRLGPSCFGNGQSDKAETDAPGKINLVRGTPPSPGSGCPALKRLSLPARLREIQTRGLAGCSALIRLELPQSLTELGDRVFDHCGSLTRLLLPAGLTRLPGYAFADCRSLESLTIPPSVTAIGSQCFYNCTHLQYMDLPCALQTIGSGLFMNCSRLKRLSFPGGINASVLLADLYQKLEVTVYTESRSIRLLFPEYAYEFEDVVMPRQFRTITYGSGGRYRECITGDTIDLELYDSLFRVAKLEEDPETVALLALFRLMTPEGLRPERQTQYLSYLHEHLAPLGQMLIARCLESELEFLLTRCSLEPQHLDTLLECASQGDHPRLVSRILDAKAHFPSSGTNKTFEL